MSNNLLENNSAPTPTLFLTSGNDLIENVCYTCTKCNSNIEIQDFNEKNNMLAFKCPNHGNITMSINEYLEKMPKNTYLYSKCFSCKQQQNETGNIFKYCSVCKAMLCNKCILNHKENHFTIGNDQLYIKCQIHPQNNNKSFCYDCNIHLCEQCLKERKHMMHKKVSFIEISPFR